MKKALVLSGGGARGAYQAGVLKYLEEINFVPDIISGTSVGAINTVAIASGMNSQRLISLWREIESDKVFKYSIFRTIWRLITRKFSFLADTSPLKKLLEEHIDLELCRSSKKKIFISAVNILNAELRYFSNEEITISHILASSAIPVIFPWQYINGSPYWDGGLMANTPIQPAVEQGARDIIVVLLSPVGAKVDLGIPKSKSETMERVFELSMIGSYQMVNNFLKKEKEKQIKMGPLESFLFGFGHEYKNLRIRTISPGKPLGLGSIMNFSVDQAESLIEAGYEDARNQLSKT
ncbi:patatin-like phospholipase family protein [Leptospira sp. GIMC2001]|uniref:patatin-like phospholipase family protein n=1 Tax=Leptospira sp. GIMC2001 TaxID=1513297 RepID=UPI0023495918|nr:patatin-like phospholipase family protein [Leptospira sp. GIMC2001]WCL47645.1 patatin-like phospholipase family protein [Leptospira sp. GIMC2001]